MRGWRLATFAVAVFVGSAMFSSDAQHRGRGGGNSVWDSPAPTSCVGREGRIWNDSGTLKVCAITTVSNCLLIDATPGNCLQVSGSTADALLIQ